VTLPSGSSETGTWSLASFPSTEPFEFTVPISFPIPLSTSGTKGFYFSAEEVEEQLFGKDSTTEEACEVGEPECIDTGCRWSAEGTNSRPESTVAGTLCAFTGQEAIGNGQLQSAVLANPSNIEDGTKYGPSGSYLVLKKKTTGSAIPLFYRGTWAVKAP
jgi:hypothetical protein